MKYLNKQQYIVFLITILSIISCTSEEEGCETETVCFGEGGTSCIERPIEGTCFN